MMNKLASPAHPLPIRIMHWIGTSSIIWMMLSGWAIYNASPSLPSRSPAERLWADGWRAESVAGPSQPSSACRKIRSPAATEALESHFGSKLLAAKTPSKATAVCQEWLTAHSDDCDQSFQRIATTVTRVQRVIALNTVSLPEQHGASAVLARVYCPPTLQLPRTLRAPRHSARACREDRREHSLASDRF
jgi:hypothetical protein